LLLQGLTQLIEKPRVLDRDNGLVGEYLEQLDLLLGKWTHLGAADADDADGDVLSHQRLMQYGADTKSVSKVAALRILAGFGLHIRDVNRLPVENGASKRNPTCQWQRRLPDGRGGRNWPVVSNTPERVAVNLSNEHIIGIAQASRIRRNLSAHAPQVRRRTGDRRQDPRCGGLSLPGLGQFSALSFELAFQFVDDAAKLLICTSCRHFGWHDHANPLNFQSKRPITARWTAGKAKVTCNPTL
jgi:hypothetical protein